MSSISERQDEQGNDDRMSKTERGGGRYDVILPVITLAVVIVGAVGTWTILEYQKEHFAWRIISSQKPGNTGVGWALEHLNEKGEALNHVVLEPFVFFSEAQAADTSLDTPGGRTAGKALQAYAAERVLDGIVLRHGWLNHTNFSKSSLKKADFREATLKSADFTESNLEEARLADANLNKANLTGATLVRAQAQRVSLEGATAIRTRFDGAKLAEGNLKQMIGIGAFFDRAEMTKARLNDAELEGASLKGTDLIGAIINDTELDYANLTDADLQKAYIGDTSFKGANISGIKLGGATGLQNAKWEGVWAWADNADAMSAATWPKGVHEEQIAWKEILSNVVVYYSTTCKEAWSARVAEEMQSDNLVVATRRYRPPEPNCVSVGSKKALNEESDTDRVAYRASSQEGSK